MRPLKHKTPLGAVNCVRFERSLDTQLTQAAESLGVTKSEIIRNALEAFLKPAVTIVQTPAKPAKPAKAKAKAAKPAKAKA